MSVRFYISVLICLSICANLSQAYLVSIDVNDEECFHENLSQQEKMGIAYDVVDGGFLDIRFRLLGPDQLTIHDDQQTDKHVTSTGRYTFSANSPGIYKFCFNNEQTSVTLKKVKFLVELQNASTPIPNHDDDSVIRSYVKELNVRLNYVKYEAEYSAFNLVTHHLLNENINWFVTGWALFEFLLIVVVMTSEILYLRKLFDKQFRV